MKERRFKNTIVSILCVLGAAVVAILVHALMPSPGAAMNEEDFDSLLVKMFGFPAVASSYFILLYLHILLVLRYFGTRSNMKPKEIGLRFGSAFALIYFMGMQEVVVESSPFKGWGFDFVQYQLFMGLGDAIPAFIICVIIAIYVLNSGKTNSHSPSSVQKNKLITVGSIAIVYFCERTLGYTIGYIGSDIESFPVPVLIWTAGFGIVFGIAYVLLYPVYYHKNRHTSSWNLTVLTLGINWMIFNSFIGMIYADTILPMLLRSGVDVAAIYVTAIFLEKWKLRRSKQLT